MWKRMVRKYNGLTYRKRYKCPKCNNYTLHIEHDEYAECKECMHVSDININDIIEKNDYQGYYTSEDLEELFDSIEEKANREIENLMLENGKMSKIGIFSEEEYKRIIKQLLISVEFDDLLDDTTIKYFRRHPERELRNNSGINDMEYWFNLLEDAHFFANKSLLGVIFYEFGTFKGSEHLKVNEKSPVFSGNFFITNSVFLCMSAWERVINLLSMLFNVSYDEVKPQNNTFKELYDKLKKIEEFKANDIYIIINDLKRKSTFSRLEKIRKECTHDISSYWRMIYKLSKEKRDYKKFNFDLELKPITADIILHVEAIYKVLRTTIMIMEDKAKSNNCNIKVPNIMKEFDIEGIDRTIPIINSQVKIYPNEIQNLSESYIAIIRNLGDIFSRHENEERLNKSIDQLSPKHVNKILYVDTVFRMKEVTKCLSDIVNCRTKSIYNIYPFSETILNEEYFIYAAVFKIYACYDKIGKVIKNILHLKTKGNCTYFDVIVKNIAENNFISESEITKSVINLLETDCFKDLCQLRNRMFHYFRLGAIYGDDGLAIFNERLIKLIYDNAKVLEPLLLAIDSFFRPKI